MSSIALKGFYAGYMNKSAYLPGINQGAEEPDAAEPGGSGPAATGADPTTLKDNKRAPAGTPAASPMGPQGATQPQDFHQSQNYGKIYDMVKGFWPGAAIGAAGVGALQGFFGRKKPGNMRRMMMMALAAGVPIGVITQLLTTGVPGGSGKGGWAGLQEAGGLLAGGAKDLATDVKTGTAWKAPLAAGKALAQEGMSGARKAVNSGAGGVPR